MFNIQRLKELKTKLSNAKELNQVWGFYMDHFSDHAEFLDFGHPTNHSLVEQVVTMTTKKLAGEVPQNLFLIIIPDYNFIHGGFFVKQQIGGVIYFEEAKQGMIALSDKPPSNLVHYSRFSGTLLK